MQRPRQRTFFTFTANFGTQQLDNRWEFFYAASCKLERNMRTVDSDGYLFLITMPWFKIRDRVPSEWLCRTIIEGERRSGCFDDRRVLSNSGGHVIDMSFGVGVRSTMGGSRSRGRLAIGIIFRRWSRPSCLTDWSGPVSSSVSLGLGRLSLLLRPAWV